MFNSVAILNKRSLTDTANLFLIASCQIVVYFFFVRVYTTYILYIMCRFACFGNTLSLPPRRAPAHGFRCCRFQKFRGLFLFNYECQLLHQAIRHGRVDIDWEFSRSARHAITNSLFWHAQYDIC